MHLVLTFKSVGKILKDWSTKVVCVIFLINCSVLQVIAVIDF